VGLGRRRAPALDEIRSGKAIIRSRTASRSSQEDAFFGSEARREVAPEPAIRSSDGFRHGMREAKGPGAESETRTIRVTSTITVPPSQLEQSRTRRCIGPRSSSRGTSEPDRGRCGHRTGQKGAAGRRPVCAVLAGASSRAAAWGARPRPKPTGSGWPGTGTPDKRVPENWPERQVRGSPDARTQGPRPAAFLTE